MGTVRRQVRIERPVVDVWAVIGDPAAISDWFPGIVAATVEGTTRVVTTASGIPMPEEIITNDAIQHRFQYRLTSGIVQNHVGTIDVFDIGDGSSLVAYATDCEPDAMALIIGGATGNALGEMKRQLERAHDSSKG